MPGRGAPPSTMGPKSAQSSKSSLVSVDPAIASRITTSSKTNATAGHSRTESSPAQTVSTFATSKSHGRTLSTPVRQKSKRSNSLRRAKNSTELLKTKTANAEKKEKQPESSDAIRGRNFTVTNVGSGGMLHLRPSPHQPPVSPSVSPPPVSLPKSVVSPSVPSTRTEPKVPSRSATIRTRSASPKRLLGQASQPRVSTSSRRSHFRSQSFSTLGESRKSLSTSKPRTLKIIINRPESSHSDDKPPSLPTLEIPIPHYRLGTPRFSAHGTPMLRTSGYTQSSMGGSTSDVSINGASQKPLSSTARALSKMHQLLPPGYQGRVEFDLKHLDRVGLRRNSTESMEPSSPISPSVYDDLAEVYNDPSVVRYSQSIREISAATKARIIAQISSDSFMDYELVSDFFLTFRSYMSPYEVLELLLARLEWAMGRFSDDGRIVRIRTFAALRHWILNYFMDDFVINRRLRVKFCEDVNRLYEEVTFRPKGTGIASDLKILQDLKRCWNGRCSLYWDAEEFNMDTDQETPLLPGGILGSRNPTYTDMNELNAASGGNLVNSSQPIPSPLPGSPKRSRSTKHKQLPSSGAAKKAVSMVESETSDQAGSCSIPRSKSRSPDEKPPNTQGPRPVSVLSRRQNAPSDLKVITNSKKQHQKASTSFDRSGEPTPLAVPPNADRWSDPHEGSIIRGFVYGPVEPFVRLPARPLLSPSTDLAVEEQKDPAFLGTQGSQPGPHSPAVKNIIGSIRRALSGKQGPNDIVITVSAPRPSQSVRGRRSTVPVNLARSQDNLKKKAEAGELKPHIRIDLLCAAAVQSFQAVLPSTQVMQSAAPSDPRANIGLALSPPLSHPEDSKGFLHPDRMPSHYTSQSGSILIVDDTASEIPVMSGALAQSYTHGSAQPIYIHSPKGQGVNSSVETQIPYRPRDQHESATLAQRLGPRQAPGDLHSQSSATTIGRGDSSNGSTSTIRNQHLSASEERGIQGVTSEDIDPEAMTASRESTRDPLVPPPALRRRPGGDLRHNQNVHELEPAFHHESLDSMLQSQSSAPDSLLLMGDTPVRTTDQFSRTKSQDPEKISMINTHSSQHLRPSFEAAVAGFSTIPDDDDGGLEATLLKLEGRYDKQSPDLSNPSSPRSISDAAFSEHPPRTSTNSTSEQEAAIRRAHLRPEEQPTSSLYDEPPEEQFYDAPEPLRYADRSVVARQVPGPRSELEDRRESDNSTPLLRRATSRPHTDSNHAPVHESEFYLPHQREILRGFPIPPPMRSPQSMKRPDTSYTDGGKSFLLDEDENLSELSSEISVDIIDYSDALGDSASPMYVAPGTAIAGLEIPSHPLAHASCANLSIQPSPELNSGTNAGNAPLTPDTSPVLLQAANGETVAIGKYTKRIPEREASVAARISAGPAHVPFILACDSQVLAQQMTIVEQSALTEIEWTDLVEMRWSDRPKSVLDWAEYMAKHDDAKGIDLVISRTNLVVKWTLSEIVLTQDINERARVLSKFIHVAAHARRLHNYATMLQITIALVSNDCARLTKTWELVPDPDKSLLKNMEPLVNPGRNFHDLRVEMESAEAIDGCIPFIGLYTHDLTYNAQKPAEIEVGDDMEPLVNFERYRTAASIIKGLLRLIDASSKYDFDPVHGIIERCLWMSALPDDRIHALSKSLE